MKKINILGTEYLILLDVDEKEMPEYADGCVDTSTKTIRLSKQEQDRNSLQNLEAYKKKVLRHEIIHAFLYESGLSVNTKDCGAWAVNEEMVDWFAIMFPKIKKAYMDADCLE